MTKSEKFLHVLWHKLRDHGWTNEGDAFLINMEPCDADDPNAHRCSLTGAILHIAARPEFQWEHATFAMELMCEQIGAVIPETDDPERTCQHILSEWEDQPGRTQQQVVAMAYNTFKGIEPKKVKAIQITIANQAGEPISQHVIENSNQAFALEKMLTEGIDYADNPESQCNVAGVKFMEDLRDALMHFRQDEKGKQ